jgi:hypothetical protein
MGAAIRLRNARSFFCAVILMGSLSACILGGAPLSSTQTANTSSSTNQSSASCTWSRGLIAFHSSLNPDGNPASAASAVNNIFVMNPDGTGLLSLTAGVTAGKKQRLSEYFPGRNEGRFSVFPEFGWKPSVCSKRGGKHLDLECKRHGFDGIDAKYFRFHVQPVPLLVS